MSTTSEPEYKKLQKMNLLKLEIIAKYFGINIDEINRHFPHIDQYISSLEILNDITKPQLIKHAKKLNIVLRDAHVATLRINFIKKIYHTVIEKRIEYGTKVTHEIIPDDLWREIEKKIEQSTNPEIEENIEEILRIDKNIYELMDYDYDKIRSSLEIKHYTTKKEIGRKVREFQNDYIIHGVAQYFGDIEDELGIIIQDVSPADIPNVNFEARNDSFNRKSINLKEYIEKYNKLAKELKTNFYSSIKPEFIGEINDTIKIFNKKFKKHLPYLKYGTREFLSHQSNSSRKKRYTSRRSNTM